MADTLVETLAADAVSGTVTEVTLFEDRASVTRAFDVTAGRQRVVLGPLTPLVSERRLSFPSGGLLVEDARVIREELPRRAADPAAWKEAADGLEAAERALAGAARATGRAREREARAHAQVEAALQATPRALIEEHPAEGWVAAVAGLAARVTEAKTAVVDAEQAEAEARERCERRRGDLEALRSGKPVWRAWLVLQVVAPAAARAEVRYTVPCAVWRPAHEAAVDTTAGRLSWELRAVCWNATGEDWSGVVLTCSTARPGDLGSPPVLQDDVVRARRRATEIVVEGREEEVQLARAAGVRRTAELPGVDDGGEPRVYRADQPVDLPSTGLPVAVRLDRFAADATLGWVATPELGGVVIRRCLARNTGPRPLLAGPVELLRDGAWVGRGRVDLVAPGEPFALGLGSHDGLRISRRVDQKVDAALVTGRQHRTFTVELRVAHLGDAPVRLRVDERVPVSELKEVTVSAPRAEPALDGPVDRDGFVRWTLELFPGDGRTLTLTYVVDAASNVQLPF